MSRRRFFSDSDLRQVWGAGNVESGLSYKSYLHGLPVLKSRPRKARNPMNGIHACMYGLHAHKTRPSSQASSLL